MVMTISILTSIYDITYSFTEDDQGGFDGLKFKDNEVFSDRVLKIDMHLLSDPANKIFSGGKVTFSGKSAIIMATDDGVIEIDEVSVSANSELNISSLKVDKLFTMSKSSSVNGRVGFAPSATSQFHWTLSEHPIVRQETPAVGTPKSIEFIYDDSEVDRETFRKLMLHSNGFIIMQGDFDCFNTQRNAKFSSSFKPFGDGTTALTPTATCLQKVKFSFSTRPGTSQTTKTRQAAAVIT